MSRGFHAMVGNPPWVSYAGRAAQPLERSLREHYAQTFASFRGYRNLQGLFIERAASLLRPVGRLGFVVPSSMSELAGYAPTRRAHDGLSSCDEELADLGNNAFEGVFQPCMLLASTRRQGGSTASPGPWPLERRDVDPESEALLERLASLPRLPHDLFGERGLQTIGTDVAKLRKAPDETHTIALRRGGDIEAFRLHAPSWFANPDELGKRLRSPAEWAEVRVLIRQTARAPVAALSDGQAFRNSLLAGFASPELPPEFLVAYLNSTPIAWLHYMRHRDARQGMPQVKIGHLRSLPAPARRRAIEPIAAMGALLSRRNEGVSEQARAELDALVGDALLLDEPERRVIARWSRSVHAGQAP